MSVVAKWLEDQDATWYGGRPQPRPHCVGWVPSSPAERDTAAPPLFLAYEEEEVAEYKYVLRGNRTKSLSDFVQL